MSLSGDPPPPKKSTDSAPAPQPIPDSGFTPTSRERKLSKLVYCVGPLAPQTSARKTSRGGKASCAGAAASDSSSSGSSVKSKLSLKLGDEASWAGTGTGTATPQRSQRTSVASDVYSLAGGGGGGRGKGGSRASSVSIMTPPTMSLKKRMSMKKQSWQEGGSKSIHFDVVESSTQLLPSGLKAEDRRQTLSSVTFSLSQLTSIIRTQRMCLEALQAGVLVPARKRRTIAIPFVNRMAEERDETLVGVPMDKEYKDFQRDFFRRMEEAATKRKSLRNRKRWLKAYRKVQTVLRICRNLAERCLIFELEPSTYVDIGDSVTVSVDYGAGRSIDTDVYKRKNEISINSQVVDTLTSMPEERTLVQLEEARRELQKVQVFSEYPLSVQEQVLRRSFYLTVGPKRVILRQGHMSQNFYIIICGEAYVKEHLWDEPSGKMVAKAAAFIKTGDVFGSNAIIRGLNRGSSVISRTNIQLLAIHGDDYLDLIFRRALPDELPPHIQYLSGMTFMENFPIQLLREKLNVASMHHFRRNTVITHDSSTCTNLFIVKYGYCKVFRKLDEKEKTAVIDLDAPKSTSVNKRLEEGWGAGARKGVVAFDAEKKTETTIDSLHQSQTYIERDSPYVNYLEMLSPAGHLVRVPLTKLPGRYDKMHNQPLTLPSDQRRFLPLITMREGEVFGLDQTPMCPFRRKSRSTILVSLGAEVIALSKDFYCRHAAKEAHELAQKTFIYDNRFIRHRLRERVNRDVHLEEVLKHYFLKASTTAAELQNTGAGGVHGVEEEAHP